MEGEYPYLGDLLSMVINHLRPSWDDPPSSSGSFPAELRITSLKVCKFAIYRNGSSFLLDDDKPSQLVVEPTPLKDMLVIMGSSSPISGVKINNLWNPHLVLDDDKPSLKSNGEKGNQPAKNGGLLDFQGFVFFKTMVFRIWSRKSRRQKNQKRGVPKRVPTIFSGCPSHSIHVWYIYLHLVDLYGFHVGKYTIHGWYGYINVPSFNPRLFRR